jgi:hypothetical protein
MTYYITVDNHLDEYGISRETTLIIEHWEYWRNIEDDFRQDKETKRV